MHETATSEWMHRRDTSLPHPIARCGCARLSRDGASCVRQIHAGWILYRAGWLLAEPSRSEVLDEYKALGFPLDAFGKGEKVRCVTLSV